MASFKAFEPSDAMVKAMEARFAAKQFGGPPGAAGVAAPMPPVPPATFGVSASPTPAASFGVSATPAPFRATETPSAARLSSGMGSASAAPTFRPSSGTGTTSHAVPAQTFSGADVGVRESRFSVGSGAYTPAASSRGPAAPSAYGDVASPAGRVPREGGHVAHSARFVGSDDWLRTSCRTPNSKRLQGVSEHSPATTAELQSPHAEPEGLQPASPQQQEDVTMVGGFRQSPQPSPAGSAQKPPLPDGAFANLPGGMRFAEVPPEDPSMLNLPSAVTVGGMPVATDGGLVYLGGGLYAAASAAPRQPPAAPRREGRERILPGRVRPLPPRPLGRGAAARSASANILRPRGGRAASPAPSRAQSDGEVAGGHGACDTEIAAGGGRSSARSAEPSAAKRVWRPSGPARLPPQPETPSEGKRSGRLTPSGMGGQPGAAQARLDARQEARRDGGLGLFGPSGVLNQLWEGQRQAEAAMAQDVPERRPPPAGPPQNGAQRRAEREAAKEARVQALLEERAARMEREAQKERAKIEKVRVAAMQTGQASVHKGMMSSASAPTLPMMGLGAVGEDSQRRRLACQMEILKFFDGYSGSAGMKSLSAEQTQALLAKLQSTTASAAGTARDAGSARGAGSVFDEVSDAEDDGAVGAEEASAADAEGELEASQTPALHQSIQGRLQEVNDQCGAAFGDVDL